MFNFIQKICVVFKVLGGGAAAVGALAGGLTPAFGPLASLVPGLAPWAVLATCLGVAAHGVATACNEAVKALQGDTLPPPPLPGE